MSNLKSFLADDSGAVSIEYGFAVLFAAAIAIAVLTVLRDQTTQAFATLKTRMETQMNNAANIATP